MRHFKDYTGGEGDFVEGTTFEHITNLYSFDRDLRDIVFEGIEIIEVAMKSLISDRMSCKHGPHWYLDNKNFMASYDYTGFDLFLKENCSQQSEYPFIRNYPFEPDRKAFGV